VAFVHFDGNFKGGGRFAFEDGFLRGAPTGFVVAEGDCLNPADEVGEGGVFEQVFEAIAVGGAD
jgi:hypothetical protein